MNWKQLLPALIPVLVPFLIAALKSWIPSLPKKALPLLCPLLGIVADYALALAGGSALGPSWGAALGMAGNGLREIYDQLSGNAADRDLVKRALGSPLVPVLVLVLLGAGCATTGSAPDTLGNGKIDADIEEAIAGLKEFTLADAQHALAITPETDVAARNCWTFWIDELSRSSDPTETERAVVGAMTAFQAIRNVLEHQTGETFVSRLNVACAAMVTSAKVTLIKMFGVKAAKAFAGIPPIP